MVATVSGEQASRVGAWITTAAARPVVISVGDGANPFVDEIGVGNGIDGGAGFPCGDAGFLGLRETGQGADRLAGVGENCVEQGFIAVGDAVGFHFRCVGGVAGPEQGCRALFLAVVDEREGNVAGRAEGEERNACRQAVEPDRLREVEGVEDRAFETCQGEQADSGRPHP